MKSAMFGNLGNLLVVLGMAALVTGVAGVARFPGGCFDKHLACKNIQHRYCTNKYVSRVCPATCKLCVPPPAPSAGEFAQLEKLRGGVITTCFLCDLRCQADAAAAASSPENYFRDLAHQTSLLFQKNGIPLTVASRIRKLKLEWSITNDDAGRTGDLGVVSKFFFKRTPGGIFKRGSIINYFSSRGCDFTFLVSSQRDPFWRRSTGKLGVANIHGMCSSTASYGVIALRRSPRSTLLLHELLHALGVTHDFNVNSYYIQNSPLVVKWCITNRAASCIIGQSNCVIANIYSSVVSACSKAYVDAWVTLGETMPRIYSSQCLKT